MAKSKTGLDRGKSFHWCPVAFSEDTNLNYKTENAVTEWLSHIYERAWQAAARRRGGSGTEETRDSPECCFAIYTLLQGQ